MIRVCQGRGCPRLPEKVIPLVAHLRCAAAFALTNHCIVFFDITASKARRKTAFQLFIYLFIYPTHSSVRNHNFV